MKKIAIIGASDLQEPLIKKAIEMGYETHVFAWKCGDVGEYIADYFYPISITEKEAILKTCKDVKIDGICSIASDLAVITVNYVANKLGLIGNSDLSSLKATNKYLMRSIFKKEGLPSPTSMLISDEDESIEYINMPCIIKPTDRSGSRGVYKVEKKEELRSCVEKAKKVSFEKKVIIEEFVEGEEYSIEYISSKGKHYFLAATKKYTTGEPRFIETGHIQPAKISIETLEKIKVEVERALDALGIENGASHTELKIDNDQKFKFIEIGARMGGDFIGSDLVRLSTGYDYLKMVIDIACGNSVNIEKNESHRFSCVRYILSDNDYNNYEEVVKKYPDCLDRSNIKIYINERDKNKTVEDSSSRMGYYIMKMDTAEEMEEIKENIFEK